MCCRDQGEAVRRLGYILLFSLAVFGCSKESEKRKTCDAVKAAVRGIYRIENAVAGDRRAAMTPIDVSGMTADELQKLLKRFNPAFSHLWMPGEKSWLVVEHSSSNSVSLAAAMEAAAEDQSLVMSLPEVFSAYVGTLEEVMPAFASDLKGEVVPEWFVSRQLPRLDWLNARGVDEDILDLTFKAIDRAQQARRTLLEGNMLAAAAKDKAGERKAIEKWAEAYKANPRDSMLLERIYNLNRNAKGFLSVGKLLQAMKCFETIILINPDDVSAVHNFGMCLKKIGRLDMAEKVLKRAEEMRK